MPELSKSKKKVQVLHLGGAQYSSIIAATSMIYRNNKAALTTEQLLEEMHIQWRLAGGKKREDNSDNEDEVALVASTKKGGKKSSGGDKPQRENPNKDKTCNHCNNKGQIKSTCWTKHPDKKPKSVKNRKSKQEGKSSDAAGAVEDNKEEIIQTAVKEKNQYVYLDNKKVFEDKECVAEEVYTRKIQTVDIPNAYHFCPVLGYEKYFKEEELQEELDEEESEEEFLSNKRMNMQSSSTGMTTMTAATTKDASQALELFGTHKCKLRASKNQELKQRQTSASAPSILVT